MVLSVFLDTNIIIDFLDPQRRFHSDAFTLFDYLERNEFKAFFSESVVTTIAYLIGKDFSKAQVHEIINGLNSRIKLLPCSSDNVEEAINKRPKDFEDALLYVIALQYDLDYFITSNTKDFKSIQIDRLPVINANNLIKIMKAGN